MIRPLLFAVLIGLPSIAGAQTAPADDAQAGTSASSSPPQRVRSVTLGAGQSCPQSSDTEIVVCSTLDQPYRIPKQFRDSGPIPAQNQAWGNRVATVDQVSRVAGGLPDTCSAVGTGGQSGCALATNRAWAAERRAQRDAESQVP
ncbi:hypothetical protein NF700_03895 [Sphingomonadaceae bacterium OTU29MARTA1]|nr:hypothetical protein NF700_03895 [Sphingomonadaceae bacterium OTU29MARTA1]